VEGVTPEPQERIEQGLPPKAEDPTAPRRPVSLAEAADQIDTDLSVMSAQIADIRRDMAAGQLTPEQFGERIASIGGLARALGSASGDEAPGCTIDELLRP
jgi:hypothetical protein